MAWRYYALDVLTKQFIHRDLPLQDVDITLTLNGPQTIRASINPEWPDLFDSDGEPLLKEWSALILAEKDGVIRAGGILVNSDFEGSKWTLDIKGFTAYAQGQILERTYAFKETGTSSDGVDPIAVVKWLWGNEGLGYFEDARLGVTFNSATSDYRLGTWKYTTTETTKVKGKNVKKTVTKTQDINGVKVTKPSGTIVDATYNLFSYDNIDVGQKIDELAKQTPFDYQEFYGWANDAHSAITMRFDFGSPRLGGKRAQLRFAEGENVSQVIAVKADGDGYANSIRVIGSGEGKDQKAVTLGTRDGRLRRMVLHADQTLKTNETLTSTGHAILNTKNTFLDITSVTLIDHPNAPIGSFGVGDDIQVETHIGWQKVKLWVRITSYSFSPDEGTVTLTTTRSDSFRYIPGGSE
ncbi:hypothetical protein OHA74_20715 [Streptomyces phaeochromogenes]|uniref:hypothetical protein n=1 Tax=Streptomyces phaeochromogenes TaxID=1923 RepID=UPI002E2E257B|nr:hypothetical protein [Streptomyces phaeochromogenes]